VQTLRHLDVSCPLTATCTHDALCLYEGITFQSQKQAVDLIMDFFLGQGRWKAAGWGGGLFRTRLLQYAAQCNGAAWGQMFLSTWTSAYSFLHLANCFQLTLSFTRPECPVQWKQLRHTWLGLCCRPESRGFESLWSHWFITASNPSNRIVSPGLTQPVDEYRRISEVKALSACKADILTAISELTA
jgi:hypothetical protein